MTLLADFETQDPYIDDYAIGCEEGINDSKDFPCEDVPRYDRCFQSDFLKLHDNIYRVIQSEEQILEKSLANSIYACYLQLAPTEMTVPHHGLSFVDTLEFKITGQVVRVSEMDLEIDCFGGDTIMFSRSRTKGRWEQLLAGDWVRATALIRESGEVVEASIESEISPPESISDDGIDEFYAKIMRGELTTGN
jgi:hypothetical protein